MTIKDLQDRLATLPPEGELRYCPRGITYPAELLFTPRRDGSGIILVNILEGINREEK